MQSSWLQVSDHAKFLVTGQSDCKAFLRLDHGYPIMLLTIMNMDTGQGHAEHSTNNTTLGEIFYLSSCTALISYIHVSVMAQDPPVKVLVTS